MASIINRLPVLSEQQNRIAASVLAIMIAVPAVFLDTTIQMVRVWTVNETFTHGYLILPISAWLLWRDRERVAGLAASPELRPLLLLLIALAGWFLGEIVDVQAVKQLAMIGMIPTIVWILLGRRIMIAYLFPLLYLFFAVPLGQGLIPVMMDFTADFTVHLIRLSGVPVFRDGLYFTLPSGSWSVVEECSGVRYLIASLALGTLYAYFVYRSLHKRALFLLAALIVPILANGLRAYGIVMLGHVSEMKLATGVDHLVYGWVFFGIVIFLLFYLGGFWSERPKNAQQHENASKVMKPVDVRLISLALILTLVSTIAVKTLGSRLSEIELPGRASGFTPLAQNYNAWQHMEDVDIGWTPEFRTPDVEVEKVYRFGSDLVQVDVGYYRYQRPGAEAVSTQNRITNPHSGAWKLTRRVDLQIDDIYVTESEIRNPNGSILVWHWYSLGDNSTPNIYIAKLFEAYNRVITGRRDAAMITIATRLDTLDDSRSRLKNFLEAFFPLNFSK